MPIILSCFKKDNSGYKPRKNIGFFLLQQAKNSGIKDISIKMLKNYIWNVYFVEIEGLVEAKLR